MNSNTNSGISMTHLAVKNMDENSNEGLKSSERVFLSRHLVEELLNLLTAGWHDKSTTTTTTPSRKSNPVSVWAARHCDKWLVSVPPCFIKPSPLFVRAERWKTSTQCLTLGTRLCLIIQLLLLQSWGERSSVTDEHPWWAAACQARFLLSIPNG